MHYMQNDMGKLTPTQGNINQKIKSKFRNAFIVFQKVFLLVTTEH